MTEYFTVENEEGDRIDRYLAEEMPERSRSYLQKLIKEQYIKVNNKPVKANYRLVLGDRVEVCIPEAKEPDIEPENIPLDILYEDEDVIVVNKPKQMVVHPAPGHYSGTLVNALMYHCGNELSGINGTVNAPIVRHPTDRKKMSIHAKNARNAITHYKVLKRFGDYTYIQCKLETGRTHQIRVHMASIGHPLLGDQVYGPKKCPFSKLVGQTLHARTLGFIHPRTNEYIEVNAPLPDYFLNLLEKLN